jgi:glycosyltransferase involved in cell wall biosynthesis
MMKPRLAILQKHPAPYRDLIFKKVNERSYIDITVLTMSEIDFGHPYRTKSAIPYPNQFLGKFFHSKYLGYFNPGIFKQLSLSSYDIYLTHTGSITGLIVILYTWLNRKALIWSNDSVLFPQPDNGIATELRHLVLKQLFKKTDAFWVPGNATQEYLEHKGVSKKQIFQGAYCLGIDDILQLIESAKPRCENIRAELGIDNSHWLFLFVGRMLAFRGVKYLVEAFHLLKQRFRNAKLLLIGDGPEKPGLQAECHRLGLSDIIFLDPIPPDRLTEYYAAADSYVTPALGEHYSLALAQAAICGLPMISTDQVGAVKDYLLDGETGFIVPAGDSQALAAAMARLITSRDLAKEMGEKAAALAKHRTVTWAAEQLEAAVFQGIDISKRRKSR